jgi:Kinesin motor domain
METFLALDPSHTGYNVSFCILAAGKTHTVIGPSSCHSSPDEPSSGMIPRAVNALFQMLKLQTHMANPLRQSTKPTISPRRSSSMKSPPSSPNHIQLTTTSPDMHKSESTNIDASISYEFQVRVQFLELYGEEIRDLLASTNSHERLTIRDIGNDEPEVVGATSHVVKSAEEALRCLTKGMLRRVTAATAMNESSSRSHAIFSILMEQTWTTTTTTTDISPTGPQVRRSKFNFVDLAGSERQKRTRAEGQRLKEGIEINKGLLTLGNVISALGDPKKRGKAFVPYRDSKLTRLLKGSLGGNHKTLMIACVSPSSTNMEESLNCLRYANRAKNIQNRAHVNVDARTRIITELKAQVASLAADLLRAMDSGDLTGGAFSRQDLIVITQGGDAVTPLSNRGNGASSSESPAGVKPAIPSTPRLLTPEHTRIQGLQQQQRAQDVEEELNRTSKILKRCRRESLALEERLHVTKAEKEFYRLQLEAVAKPVDAAADSGPSALVHIDQLFVDRASAYEREIDRLKDELRVVRSQLVEQREPAEDEAAFSVEKANQDMREERERLVAIQNELLVQDGPPTMTHYKESREGVDESLDLADSEEKAEEEHLTELTLKYSHIDDEDEVVIVDHTNSPRLVEASNATQIESAGKVAEQRRAQIEADLLEISRIIESKEELISQLQCSQAKYSVCFEVAFGIEVLCCVACN